MTPFARARARARTHTHTRTHTRTHAHTLTHSHESQIRTQLWISNLFLYIEPFHNLNGQLAPLTGGNNQDRPLTVCTT